MSSPSPLSRELEEAVAAWEGGRFAEARRALRRLAPALSEHPELAARAQLLLGKLELEGASPDRAEAAFGAAEGWQRAAGALGLEARAGRAEALARLGRPDEARALFSTPPSPLPPADCARWSWAHGSLLARLGEGERGRELLLEARGEAFAWAVEERAALEGELGRLELGLGRRDEARRRLGAAWTEVDALAPSEPVLGVQLKLFLALAEALALCGEAAAVEPHFQRMVTRARTPPQGSEALAVEAIRGLGGALLRAGELERARALLEGLAQRVETGPADLEASRARIYVDLATLCARAGELTGALAWMERAVGLGDQHGSGELVRGKDLAGLGSLLLQAAPHRAGEARRHLRRALTLLTSALGEEHPQVALTLLPLAYLALADGEAAKARALAERAQEVLRRAGLGAAEATAHNLLGAAASRLGGDPEPHFRAALALLEAERERLPLAPALQAVEQNLAAVLLESRS